MCRPSKLKQELKADFAWENTFPPVDSSKLSHTPKYYCMDFVSAFRGVEGLVFVVFLQWQL